LGLRVRGALVNAAVVVFGREFLPHYPQCQLRLASICYPRRCSF
jgi:hypothetical protein